MNRYTLQERGPRCYQIVDRLSTRLGPIYEEYEPVGRPLRDRRAARRELHRLNYLAKRAAAYHSSRFERALESA